jgi:hypothetical protein
MSAVPMLPQLRHSRAVAATLHQVGQGLHLQRALA